MKGSAYFKAKAKRFDLEDDLLSTGDTFSMVGYSSFRKKYGNWKISL